MRLRELPVKKHIHAWGLSAQKLAEGGWYLQRTCSEYDCRRTESSYLEHLEIREYPQSLLANADVDWSLGDIATVYPDAEAVFSYFHGLV